VRRFAAILAAVTLACGGSAPPPDPQGAQAAPPPESESPVALNPDVPIAYPPALFEQRIEGEVVLRLFTDSTGRLIPESTRVAESSDYPALDSAAVAGSARLRFAPAKRHGIAVATTFLQPVEFHHPGTTGRAPAVTVPAPQRVTQPVPPRPRAAAPSVQAAPPPPVARPRPDTIRPPTDTTRHPADTTRPRPPVPTDTTRSRPDARGPAH
jgi:TonB family protein